MRNLSVLMIILCLISMCSIAQEDTTITGTQDSAIHTTDSTITFELKDQINDNIPSLSLDDNELGDAGAQNISSQLTAGRDPFFNAAAFNFSAVRFRVRGYDGDLTGVYINNIQMDNLDNGYTPFGLWGGLNDVFRNRDLTIGLKYNTYTFGDIGNTANIDVRASKQRAQTSVNYAISNRNYTHRLMLTHSTGLGKKGWAFTVSAGRRYADEGYVPGTYYNGWSWFAAVDKKIGQKQLLSLIAFAAPLESGGQSASVMEIKDLAESHYYNPSSGYQDGKKRNAAITKNNQPVFILSHEFRLTNKTGITTSFSYITGNRSYSSLDWYNAPDPRADYYRYLPSYYTFDASLQQDVYNNLKHNEAARQISWDELYNINRDNNATVYNANGIAGNTVTGNRSYYILGERVTHTNRFSGSSVINSRLTENINITAGLSFQHVSNHYYQRISDLLGGSFWVDLNQFAERDFPSNSAANQNNLLQPNRIVHKGDKYGYNYNITINKPAEWAQLVLQFNHLDFFVAAEVSETWFWRTGNVKNGLFPDNSFGKSSVNVFTNYAVKGGITYKLNGRNYFYLNGALLTRPPYFENAYISARTRDLVQDSLRSESVKSFEGGYVLNAPNVKLRLTGFYTGIRNGFNVLTFYHDEYASFVNYALSHIDRLYFGGEFGLEVKVARNLTVNAAATVGRYYYNSRQKAIITIDNTAAILDTQTVYSKNYRVPGTPQEAYTASITYRSPKFWFVSLTGSYFRQMWLDFNPIRRTYQAVNGIDPKSDIGHEVLDQQQLPAKFTMDFFGGYSWRLPNTGKGKARKPVTIAFYTGVNNLLDNQNIISGGYEQLRYDYGNVGKFPPKYYYAYGINYFISAQLRF